MMETLFAVSQHRNQYYSRSRGHGPVRFESFGSPPSEGFRDINCRTFQSGAGILRTPRNSCTTPVTKRAFPCASSPKPQSLAVNSYFEDLKSSKRTVKCSTTPIPFKNQADRYEERSFYDRFSYSERWAGPAYSNSPPPSSLPIPKFSIRPKRTASLELPASSASGIDFDPIAKSAKSAPPSPTREHNSSSRDLFHSADSATKTLRRILNLDIADE